MSVLPSQGQGGEPPQPVGQGDASASAQLPHASAQSPHAAETGGCGLCAVIRGAGRFVWAVIYWCWWFFVYTVVTLEIGALIGALLFAGVGALSHPQLDILRRIEMGLADGFFYAGVWAGGLAIVLCFMRAHKRNLRRRRAAAAATGSGADAAASGNPDSCDQSHKPDQSGNSGNPDNPGNSGNPDNPDKLPPLPFGRGR